MSPPPFADAGAAAPDPTGARPPIFDDPKVTAAFAKHGRRDGSAEAARALVEAHPEIASSVGLSPQQFIDDDQWSISLDDALAAGLFEPIEGCPDPFADLRK